jgi:Fic family protein
MLFKNRGLGKEELRVMSAIGSLHKALRYTLSNPSRWSGLLRRNTFARAIRGSNSIEGYLVTAEDAIAAVNGDEPMDAEQDTWLAVTGYRNAMTYVLQLAKDPNFEFSEGYIRSFHFMMLQHDLTKHPGNWRPGPIYVRDEKTDDIGELVAYVDQSRKDEPIIRAAMTHLNLVMIHPFSDGNGRMGRCLQTLILASGGIVDPTFSSIEEYLGRNTQEYYDVLAKVGRGSWNPQNDTGPWIRFNLTAHYRQAATLLRRTRMISKLSDAAMGYRVRSSNYRHIAEVSKVVASRDLRAAVEAELLIPHGERKGRVYSASASIIAAAKKIRGEEPGGIPDPFETGVLITG